MYLKYVFIVFLGIGVACCADKGDSENIGELSSENFKVEVGGESVFVYQARVSKYPINQNWPGYQRPLEQTEIASFASFDYEAGKTVRITTEQKIESCDIRPKEFGIIPEVKGNTIEFVVTNPCQFVVEVNGHHKALHLFVNPKKQIQVDKEDSRIHYYGPGVHEAGVINVKSDETVYIDEGAIVYGVIRSENTSNIKVIGKGILDASRIARGVAPHMISLHKVRNAYIGGIILRDAHEWGVVPSCCDQVTFDNIKLIGFWRYNSDGIDIVNSSNIVIKNSFIRAFDDNIAIKGLQWAYEEQQTIKGIRVDNCVLWNDWGKIFEFGAETVADTIQDVMISNCYVPRFTMVAMDIQNGDRGHIENVVFNNISIEEPIRERAMLGDTPMDTKGWGRAISLGIYGTQWSSDVTRGSIDNIRFSNIRCTGSSFSSIELKGYDEKHQVSNVYIKDYFVNGTKITGDEAIQKNDFVTNVVWE